MMSILRLARDVYTLSKTWLTTSAVLSLVVALFLNYQGIKEFNNDALNMALAAIALYVGAFTAFLGLLFNLVVTPLNINVEKKRYLLRLKGIKHAIRTTTLSIFLALSSVPLLLLSQTKGAIKGCPESLNSACSFLSSTSLFSSLSIFTLSIVFCITVLILKQMYVLSMLAAKERAEAIEDFFPVVDEDQPFNLFVPEEKTTSKH